jgi:hypothetical protein
VTRDSGVIPAMADDGGADRRGVRWLRAMLVLYVLAVVVATLQRGGIIDPRVEALENNFRIFRWAYFNLVQGVDLYAAHTEHYNDLFKYSPTFALFFAPFAPLPFWLGLTLWNAANALSVWWAVTRLLPTRQAALVLSLCFIEVLTAVQRAQSNALVAALIILAFLAFQRGWFFRAALAIGAGAFIKIFPLAMLMFGLFERRVVRFALIFVAVMAGLAALPLVVTTPAKLAEQYASWRAVEASDAGDLVNECVHCKRDFYAGGALYGGVMQQLRIWTGKPIPNWPVQLVGTLLLLLPMAVRWRDWGDPDFRRRLLTSLLVYVVIFNHQSESPSFVIAMLGVAIWYATSARTWWHTALMALTVSVVSIGYSDAMPAWVRGEIFGRYRLKTVPCVVVWVVMQLELLRPEARSRKPDGSLRVDGAGMVRG